MFMFQLGEIFGYSSPFAERTMAKLSRSYPTYATQQRNESLLDKSDLLCESSGLCHWWRGFGMCELSPSRDWKTKSSIFPHEVLPVANDRFEDNLTDRNICGRAHPHSARACVCLRLSWKPGLNPQPPPHPPRQPLLSILAREWPRGTDRQRDGRRDADGWVDNDGESGRGTHGPKNHLEVRQCGAHSSPELMAAALWENLQRLRDKYGTPLLLWTRRSSFLGLYRPCEPVILLLLPWLLAFQGVQQLNTTLLFF